jgi:hypothetical protein
MWTLYVYGCITPGFILLALFCINIPALSQFASMCAGPQIDMPFAKVQLSTFMCAGSLLFAFTSLLSFWRHEDRYLAISSQADQRLDATSFYLKMYFYDSRQVLMFSTGALLWGMIGRFKVFVETRQLRAPPANTGRARPMLHRVLFGLLAVTCIILGDIPLCRVDYNSRVSSVISMQKHQALQHPAAPLCANAMLDSAVDSCADFCNQVQQISLNRQEITMAVRDFHIPGRIAAEIFDFLRLEDQDTKSGNLFAQRTCSRVLQSIDKTNKMVNYFCIFMSIAAIVAFLAYTAVALGNSRLMPDPAHDHND